MSTSGHRGRTHGLRYRPGRRGAGHDVMLRDVADEAVPGARARIETSLARFAEKGTISAPTPRPRWPGSPRPPTSTAVADADIVVEAVFEKLEIKHEVFRDARPDLPRTTRCSPPTPRPSRSPRSPRSPQRPEPVVGTHFFSPGADDEAVRAGPRLQDQRRDAGRRRGSSPRRSARPASSSTGTSPASSPPG